MPIRLNAVRRALVRTVATAGLSVDTNGKGFVEITREVRQFLDQVDAADGILLAYLRHTSASLVIQENADPDVRPDLTTALDRLAPEDGGWAHDSEGPDDMPAHVKTMLTGVSLHVPVIAGALGLGTWQGIFLAEHRARPHAREVILQFVGSQKHSG
jgi:secondary thiamine-phosphate synthase enzyme